MKTGVWEGHTDEREGGEKVLEGGAIKGQGKEAAKGESKNNQTVKQGGVRGSDKVVSPLFSSLNFLLYSCLFLCFSIFSTHTRLPHFLNHTFILKSPHSLSDKWYSFFQESGSENLAKL